MNQLRTIFLLGVLTAVLIGIGGALGPGYLYGFTALALIINFGSYFFSDRIVLTMHHAQELRGVIAHELAHIKNRDILVATIAAGIAAAVTYIAHAAQFAAIFGGSRDDEDNGGSMLGMILLAVVAPIGATLVQLGISRSREYLADETAARLTGEPGGLARALEKLQLGAERIPSHAEPATASLFIVSPLAGRGSLLGLFSTHPPMEERIARLRGMTGRFEPTAA